jgi:hypothetical protein
MSTVSNYAMVSVGDIRYIHVMCFLNTYMASHENQIRYLWILYLFYVTGIFYSVCQNMLCAHSPAGDSGSRNSGSFGRAKLLSKPLRAGSGVGYVHSAATHWSFDQLPPVNSALGPPLTLPSL